MKLFFLPLLIIGSLFFFSPTSSSAQTVEEWRVYSAIYNPNSFRGKRTYNIKAFDDEVWFLQSSGITRYNPLTKEQRMYHTYDVTNSFGTFTPSFGDLSTIADLTKDNSGNLWTCTDRGIYKLENDRWKSINVPDSVANAPIPPGAPFSFFYQFADIEFDQNNVLWIAAGAYIWSYDGQDWTGYDYRDYTIDPVQALAVDQNNVLWVTSYTGELASFDGTTWTHYLLSNLGILYKTGLSNPYVDQNNVKWFGLGCSGGITNCRQDSALFLTYNDTTWNIITEQDINTTYYNIYKIEGKNNELWSSTEQGFLEYEAMNWTEHNVSNLGTFDVDDNGELWLGGFANASKYDGNSTTPVSVGINSFTRYLFTTGATRNLSSSQEGRVWWINSGIVGNVHFDSSKVTVLEQLSAYNLPNSKAIYNKIVANSNTDVWIAQSDTTGIWHYDGTSLLFTPLDTQLAPYNTFVRDLVVVNNEAWLATSAGLFKWDGSSWTGNSFAPLNASLEQMVSLPSGSFWLSQDNQLFLYDGITVTTYDHTNSNLPDAAFTDLYYNEKDSSLWVTTDSAGLVEYSGGVWSNYTSQSSSLPSNFLTVVTQDSSGNSWIGSQDSGLIKLDITGQFVTVNKDNNDYKLENKVFSITVDEHENVWYLKGDQLFVYQEGGLVNIDQLPTAIATLQSSSYPNPFSQSSTIQYTLTNTAQVSLQIYDLQGRLIEQLLQGEEQAQGQQQIEWQPKDRVPAGLYIYAIFVDDQLVGQGKVVYQK